MNNLEGYVDRFDASKKWEKVLFRASGNEPIYLQQAELVEVQSMSIDRLRGVADAILKDGAIIRDARASLNSTTGLLTLESGALYIRGAVRGVAPATFTIPTAGTVAIGVRLVDDIVTELDDPTLYGPIEGTAGYMQKGAARQVTNATWGHSAEVGAEGEFYPVYTAVDGSLLSSDPAPQIDGVRQAIARYDVDNSGGTYVVSGLTVSAGADLEDGTQSYVVDAGRARIQGYDVELSAAERRVLAATPDLRTIASEPHVSSGTAAQTVPLDRGPVASVDGVQITAEKTVTLTHGAFTGFQDILPDSAHVSIQLVKQGTTTYTATTDYKLTAGKVDWTPGGAEPLPGSTYDVTYRYITTVAATEVTGSSCKVAGAVAGTPMFVTYKVKLPRIDRLCLSRTEGIRFVKGSSADYDPVAPTIPASLLPLALIYQNWTAPRRVDQDGTRTVSMQELSQHTRRLDALTQLVLEQRLRSDAGLRDSAFKRGMFVDPLLNDDMRNAGVPQTAAIVNGELRLPIAPVYLRPDADIAAAVALPYTHKLILDQSRRTGGMKVNPYKAFAPLPAEATLLPPVDVWSESATQWANDATELFEVGSGTSYTDTVTQSVRTLSTTTSAIALLRQTAISFSVKGFGPGEKLSFIAFDGLTVSTTPASIVADANGVLTGMFTIPPNVQQGRKSVAFVGLGGSRAGAFFEGGGTLTTTTQQNVSTTTRNRYTPAPPPPPPAPPAPPVYYDPPAAAPSVPVWQPVVGVFDWNTWTYVDQSPTDTFQGRDYSQLVNSGWQSTQWGWIPPAPSDKAQYSWMDPLAQTWSLRQDEQISRVELQFVNRGASPVAVEIRGVDLGVPTSTVIGRTRQESAALSVVEGTWSAFDFATPQLCSGITERAFVVATDDPDTEVKIAELGKFDAAAQVWVSAQPEGVGVLLSSSNNSTWTAHQDRDLTMRVYAARYTETKREVALGKVTLVNATDIIVSAMMEINGAGTRIDFELGMPDGSKIVTSASQVVKLAAPVSGDMTVKAVLYGNEERSPILYPGTQVAAGRIATTGNYVGRFFAAGAGSTATVIIEALVPSGASVTPTLVGDDAGDAPMTLNAVSNRPLDDGWREFVYSLPATDEDVIALAINLTGNTAARPRVRDPRAYTTAAA